MAHHRRSTLIALDGLSWTYAGAGDPTLTGVSLSVAEGECVVLCGASGSGKSTLLRAVNGLIPHFHEGHLDGSVRVAGRAVAATPLEEMGRLAGTVLQHPRRQFFTDSCEPEIALALENAAVEPGLIRTRVDELVKAFGLGRLRHRRLRDLSGGQQQLVAAAAALAHAPRLLLLDEPTSNLSAAAVERLAGVLRQLRAEGITLLVAEHRLGFLRGIADRVIVMRDGGIHTEWSRADFATLPEEVLAREGLRGATPTRVDRPHISAAGASVAPTHVGGVSESSTDGLTLHEVRCRLGSAPVLSIDHAHFPRGRVTAVRGGNGAGKTTLARVITGLQRHRGTITLQGQELTRSRRQRVSALVMQDAERQLFTESVAEELRLAASAGRNGSSESVDALVVRVGLGAWREQHPLALSGGQQQRLVVATTKLTDSQVVIFDEPSSGCDRRHLASIASLIREVADEGAVVVLISHDEALLAAVADLELELVSLAMADTATEELTDVP